MTGTKILTLAGVFLNVVGVFLPWGQEVWPAGVMGPHSKIGIGFPLGIITLVGSIIFVLSFLMLELKEWRLAINLMVIGGVAATVSPLLWIMNPGTLSLSSLSYRVVYGVYVSFIGGCLELIGMAIKINNLTK